MDRMKANTERILADDGMTIMEVMVAFLILVVVVTAMLPMLLKTTNMASQAKAQTEITNAVSTYIEQIRSLPYEQVGIVGDSSVPSASIDPTSSVTVDSYTVLMAADIDWVDDPDLTGDDNYKQLTIAATATAEGLPTLTYTTSTYIWGHSDGGGSECMPLVTFTSSSPGSADVVYGSAVLVGGHAEALSSGADIASLVLKVDSEYLPNSSGSFAEFTPMETPAEETWLWDTTARTVVTDGDGFPILDGDGHPQYLYFSPDGQRVLKVEAWDTLGLTNYATRVVIVDNYAPSPTNSVTLTYSGSTALTATWDEAMDGTDPAAGYNIRLRKASTTPASPSEWGYTSSDIGAVSSAGLTGTPFSQYFVEVQSESPRGLVDTAGWVASSTIITRPELTGTFTQTVTKSGSKYTLSTAVVTDVSDPTFATSGVVTYNLWRSTSLATLGTGAAYKSGVAYGSGTWSETITDATSYKKGDVTPTYYYLVRASFTPYGAASATELWTNIGSVPGQTINAAGTTSGTMTRQW